MVTANTVWTGNGDYFENNVENNEARKKTKGEMYSIKAALFDNVVDAGEVQSGDGGITSRSRGDVRKNQ